MTKDNTNKIKALLKKFDDGKNVSMRDMHTAIGDEGVNEYESRWQAELDRRAVFADKPEVIKEYEEILKKADFAHARAVALKVGKRAKRDRCGYDSKARLHNSAESYCEDALGRLEEIITVDRGMQIWFDRSLDFTVDGTLYADVALVPRVVTSRSEHNLMKNVVSGISKESIKREVLECALGLDGVVGVLGLEDTAKLKGLMAKLGREN
jgi:hypothetical protein